MSCVMFPELQTLSGLKRRSDVRRWLQANGVPFMVQPSGAPVTTLDAINRALYGKSMSSSTPDFSPPPSARRRSKGVAAPRPQKRREVRT